jgi:hypothetical protein
MRKLKEINPTLQTRLTQIVQREHALRQPASSFLHTPSETSRSAF